jgi:hypothetical protein
VFLGALANLVQRPLHARPTATGTTEGAALLALGLDARTPRINAPVVAPLDLALDGYRAAWDAAVAG